MLIFTGSIFIFFAFWSPKCISLGGSQGKKSYFQGGYFLKLCLNDPSVAVPASLQLSFVQSLSRVNYLWPHRPQHARPPCPSPTPGASSNSCPLSWWCHPTISTSAVVFSSCLQAFAASGSFPVSQFSTSGGQSTRVSVSASVLPMNIQDWFPLGWTGWISSQSRDSQESSPTPQFKSINSSVLSFLYSPTLTSIHDY